MWTLNNEPAPREPGNGWLLIDGTQYPPDWPHEDLLALGLTWVEPEPVMPTVEQLCADIDKERDRRMAEDFTHDFGATPAQDDLGNQIVAGERQLQMRPEDRANWQTALGVAHTAVLSGAPDTIVALRAEDNWNIQTTALQVMATMAAMASHGAALLFAGGALKSQQRAIYPEAVDISTGWPS